MQILLLAEGTKSIAVFLRSFCALSVFCETYAMQFCFSQRAQRPQRFFSAFFLCAQRFLRDICNAILFLAEGTASAEIFFCVLSVRSAFSARHQCNFVSRRGHSVRRDFFLRSFCVLSVFCEIFSQLYHLPLF